jgi:hypothetical protein
MSVRIRSSSSVEEQTWMWQHREGELSSPGDARLVDALQANAQYRDSFDARSRAGVPALRRFNAVQTDRRMLADRLRGAARTRDTPPSTSAKEMRRLSDGLSRGEEVEAGKWLLEFISGYCVRTTDPVIERVTVEVNGCVWLTVYQR